jgi:hypothetical protein
LKIIVDITKEDIWSFNKYALRYNYKGKFNFYSTLFAIAVLGISVLELKEESLLRIIIVSVISIPLAYLIMAFLLKFYITKRATSSKGVLGEHVIEISVDGLKETTDVNDSFHSWKGIVGVVQNKDYIFIYINPSTAHIIPKRFFSSKDESRQFFNSALMYWKQYF